MPMHTNTPILPIFRDGSDGGIIPMVNFAVVEKEKVIGKNQEYDLLSQE